MKILIVCRWHGDHAAAFIMEQVDSLRALGHEVEYCTATKGGIMGYVELFRNIRKAIKTWQPDILHAHYGICGFIANLATRSTLHAQRSTPIITTYPGSDINNPKVLPLSRLCIKLSKYNLFMSQHQIDKVADLAGKAPMGILRYGVMADLFQPMDKHQARELFAAAKPNEVKWNDQDKYVLFSSKFTRLGKDPELAHAVIAHANKSLSPLTDNPSPLGLCPTINHSPLTIHHSPLLHLLPLTGGYTKEEMVWLMNAVDAAIVTSKSEGSPQFTKEVMCCGTPIVSVEVGDVREQFTTTQGDLLPGYFMSSTRDPQELADLLLQAVAYGKTTGHEHVLAQGLSLPQVAQRLMEIYDEL